MKKLTTALVLAASCYGAATANASLLTYEFSFTAADVFGYDFADGADGSTAADNGLFDGARLARETKYGGPDARTYVQSQRSDFQSWASTTTDKLTTMNLWGFDGRGAGWGEDYKHTDRAMVEGPTNWADWNSVGWVASWGANPNPYTDMTAGWFATDFADALGFGDASLASEEFSFRMTFDTNDWLYGASTNGAPNTLGGPMTFWFGGWMGDANNMYKYIYEGNTVLTGTQVPVPATLLLLGLGLAGLGFSRRRS